ncbi:MAG: YciI family protein [Planctomycetota bacterium]
MPHALVTLSPGPRFAEQQRLAAEHVRFIEGLMARHAVLCGGVFEGAGPEFGAYVLRCHDVKEAERTAAEDPYVREKVCVARVRGWRIVAVDPAAAVEP